MRKKLRLEDHDFFFGGQAGSDDGYDPQRRVCHLCGKNFNDHGLTVYIGPRDGADVSRCHGLGPLCGRCLTSGATELARISRMRAPIVRQGRPHRLDDETWGPRQRAEALLSFADLFDSISGLDAFRKGTLAAKIGEGYLERGNGKTKGKAA